MPHKHGFEIGITTPTFPRAVNAVSGTVEAEAARTGPQSFAKFANSRISRMR